jgi:hypothetical protein
LQFDGSNLRIGAPPSAWASGSSALQNVGGAFWSNAATLLDIPQNAYYASGGYTYSSTNPATFYRQLSGEHRWYNAPSGTAGSIITFTQAMTLDASGNLGIGTPTPSSYGLLSVVGGQVGVSNTSDARVYLYTGTTQRALLYADATRTQLESLTSNPLTFWAGSTERMRILSGGGVCINTEAAIGLGGPRLSLAFNGSTQWLTNSNDTAGASGARHQTFYSSGNEVGSITTTTTATTYTTTSDYRLKEDISPMTGALVKVARLRPVTYKWKLNGSDGQGFIAHELQAVIPDAVTSEKDAVDADGKPKYQGVDTSFLVATLTAAIQELAAKVAELEAKI